MVYLITDTVDIHCFTKIDMKNKRTPAFQATYGFVETNREVPGPRHEITKNDLMLNSTPENRL